MATQTETNIVRKSGLTFLELEHKLAEIEDQIEHWQQVHEDMDESVMALEKREANAKEMLAEIEAGTTLPTPGDRRRISETLDAVDWRLKRDRRRGENATTQLSVWRQRLKEFPHDELAQLRKAQARRERLKF